MIPILGILTSFLSCHHEVVTCVAIAMKFGDPNTGVQDYNVLYLFII